MRIQSLLVAACCGFILASCGGGGGGADHRIPPVVPTTNPPAAPGAITATVASGTVTLSWQGVTSANYYNIYYRDTPGVTTQNGTKIGNVSPPQTISDLINGQPYYFIVTGENSGGEGNASAEIEATPELQRTKIVGGVRATPGAGEVTIEWDSQVEASSYNLYWWTDLQNQKIQVSDVTSPYVMSGLENGAIHYFEVAAVNDLGEGQHSPGAHATPVDPATGWTPQLLVTDRHFQMSGGQSEGTSIGLRDMSSNDTGVIAMAASVCSGRCSIRSVVMYHNAEGNWAGPVNVEDGVATRGPKVVVTPAGHILVAYERDVRGIYARSYRNGVWEDSVRIDSRGFQYFRASVDLASDDAGNIFAIWKEAIDLVPNDRDTQVQQVWASRYDTQTDSWSLPTMLAESVRGVSQLMVDMSETNQAIAVWLQDTQAYDPDLLDGGPERSIVYTSRFDGNDWSVATPLGSATFVGRNIALDVNAAGSAIVTSYLQHYDENGLGQARVEANRFDAVSEQWDPPVLLHDSWSLFTWPVAHIDDTGHAVAAWGGSTILGAEYDPQAAAWGSSAPVFVDGAAGNAHLDTDSSGRSVAFWTTHDQVDGIHTSSSQDGRATWGPVNLLGAHAETFVVSVNSNGSVIVGASSRLNAHDGEFWGTETGIYISTYAPSP